MSGEKLRGRVSHGIGGLQDPCPDGWMPFPHPSQAWGQGGEPCRADPVLPSRTPVPLTTLVGGGGVTIPCPQRWPSRFGRRCSPHMSGDGCSGSLMTRTGTRSCQPSGPHWGYWSVTSLPHGGVSPKTAACCENPEAPPLPPLLGSPAGKQPVAVWVCPLSHLEMGKKGRSQRREAPRSCPVAPPAPGRQRCSTAARVRPGHCRKATGAEFDLSAVNSLQVEL